MAEIDLKTLTPDTSLPSTGFLFGADSQSAAAPSVYSTQTVATALLGASSLTGATVTADSPVLNMAQTWNNAAVTFTALKFNVTDTASAAGSLLMDLQRGGTSVFRVTKAPGAEELQLANSTGRWASVSGSYTKFMSSSNTNLIGLSGNVPGVFVFSGGAFSFADASVNVDLFLTRRGTANLRLGAADAAAPVAQTLSVQSVVAGTTNTAGANLTITGSQGTGTGAGGSIVFQVAPAGSTGSAQNALATALTISPSGGTIVDNASGLFEVKISGTAKIQTYLSGPAQLQLASDVRLSWSASTTPSGAGDLILARDAANTLALRNGANGQTFRVYNTTDGTNSEFGSIRWASNVLNIGPETAGTGSIRPTFIGSSSKGITLTPTSNSITLTPDGGSNVVFTASAMNMQGYLGGGTYQLYGSTQAGNINRPGSLVAIYPLGGSGDGAAGQVGLYASLSAASGNGAHTFELAIRTFLPATGNPGLQFGGTTSSFPALKRSSTTLQARLADDSAFASVQGKLTTDTAYAAGDPTTTGYLVVYDSTGAAFKIPAVAV